MHDATASARYSHLCDCRNPVPWMASTGAASRRRAITIHAKTHGRCTIDSAPRYRDSRRRTNIESIDYIPASSLIVKRYRTVVARFSTRTRDTSNNPLKHFTIRNIQDGSEIQPVAVRGCCWLFSFVAKCSAAFSHAASSNALETQGCSL